MTVEELLTVIYISIGSNAQYCTKALDCTNTTLFAVKKHIGRSADMLAPLNPEILEVPRHFCCFDCLELCKRGTA